MKPLLFLSNLLLLVVADPPLNGPQLFFDDKAICRKDLYCGKNPNTWCKTKCKLTQGCAILDEGMEKFRADMLEIHNDFRNSVANGSRTSQMSFIESVANMHAVLYDSELEAMARCKLATCEYEHDGCRKTPKYRYTGQNIWDNMKTSFKAETIGKEDCADFSLKSWFINEMPNLKNEYMFVQGYQGAKNPAGQYGHLSVGIWATVDRVGCARSWIDCSKNFFASCKGYRPDMKHLLVTCNYANSDNAYKSQPTMLTGTVLVKGPACSKCPKNLPCDPATSRFPALCGGAVFPKPRPPLLGGYPKVGPNGQGNGKGRPNQQGNGKGRPNQQGNGNGKPNEQNKSKLMEHVSSKIAVRSWTLGCVNLIGLSMALVFTLNI